MLLGSPPLLESPPLLGSPPLLPFSNPPVGTADELLEGETEASGLSFDGFEMISVTVLVGGIVSVPPFALELLVFDAVLKPSVDDVFLFE